MEFRVGSAPSRSVEFSHGGVFDSGTETPLSGFLNRKCVIEAGGKKSKDRTWQTYWCQLKGVSLEFHRVDGVKSEGFKPPPRDIFPPPNMVQHKAGWVSVDGATAEDDYTSQIGKDLQKRRSWLFELTLPSQMVYLLQAPNDTQRAQWIQHIRRAASGKGDDVEGRKLKAARCSVRHRSRQNVLSVKGGQLVKGDEEDTDLVTAVRGNPCVHHLREMLRAKKELVAQMSRMCNTFLGDSQQMYREEVKSIPSGVAEHVSPVRRLSLPSPGVSSVLPLPYRISPRGTSSSCVSTCLLTDYILVPGASWSRLKEGEEVMLTGKLTNGWYRCMAKRDMTVSPEEGMDSFSLNSSYSDNRDSGVSSYKRDSTSSDTLPDLASPIPASPSPTTGLPVTSDILTSTDPEDETGTTRLSQDNTTDQTQDQQQSHGREKSPQLGRVGRSYSYIVATQSNPEGVTMKQNPRRSLDYSTFKKISEEESPRRISEELIDFNSRLEGVLARLTRSRANSYRFPLLGVVPSSVVEKVPEMADLPLITPPVTGFTSQSTSHHHLPSHEQLNGHITTPSHSYQPSTTPPSSRSQSISSSAPTTPHHYPSQSLPASIPGRISPAQTDIPPGKFPLSPTKSPRASRRRAYEPVTAMLDNTFIKKLLPRKKPSKQTSLPDKLSISHTPTIEEEAPYSLSPSPVPPSPTSSPLPPPAMLEFSDREIHDDIRTRVSSVSGRPIKSTGICLQFGDEESSSESDIESISEFDMYERLSLSQSLPTEGGFPESGLNSTSGLLIPPRISPDILAPGNLRRAASAHGTLNFKVEERDAEAISPGPPSRSSSTHSLTSAIVRGLHNSFKRSSSKKKRRASFTDRKEPESPKFGGIFRQPPSGQKRFVYLDPRQPKYGFRLESYGRPSELGQEVQVFVQSVNPGSPAFMSGLYPGDTILEVNGVGVRSDPVAAVVKRIQDCPRKSDKRVQITVMFVDGVTRLELMKKSDHLKYHMKMKQAHLRAMISEEFSHLDTVALPLSSNTTQAAALEPWNEQTSLIGLTPHLYPYDRVLNERVALCSVHPTSLACDVLVVPLCTDLSKDNVNILTQMVRGGGPELLDELSLSGYCPPGDFITTRGYTLPSCFLYHCVLSNQEESLVQCLWRALDNGRCCGTSSTIVFWLDGFSAANVSPHTIIECVRLWLQGGGNSHKYKRIVFSAEANTDLAKILVERYFPLALYYYKQSGPYDDEDSYSSNAEDEESAMMASQSIPSQESTATPQQDDGETSTSDQTTSSRTLNAQRMESDV